MTNINIKKLVEESYRDGQLIKEHVEYIAAKLTRKELKEYISLLKAEEIKKQVFVTSAEELSNADIAKIQKIYPYKMLVKLKKILMELLPHQVLQVRSWVK